MFVSLSLRAVARVLDQKGGLGKTKKRVAILKNINQYNLRY